MEEIKLTPMTSIAMTLSGNVGPNRIRRKVMAIEIPKRIKAIIKITTVTAVSVKSMASAVTSHSLRNVVSYVKIPGSILILGLKICLMTTILDWSVSDIKIAISFKIAYTRIK